MPTSYVLSPELARQLFSFAKLLLISDELVRENNFIAIVSFTCNGIANLIQLRLIDMICLFTELMPHFIKVLNLIENFQIIKV